MRRERLLTLKNGEKRRTEGCRGRGDRKIYEEESQHKNAVRQAKSRQGPGEGNAGNGVVGWYLAYLFSLPHSFPPFLCLPAAHFDSDVIGVNGTAQGLEA